ncbi:MAG: hypothetical protein KAT32_01985 [Candidatus Moranbacteria bacterium]|nr:hypothetical protein [Candidatus Moranbacteria bacterium]
MSKGHRQGGKIKGRHTTIIPVAEKIVDLLSKNPEVKKISVGFIKHGIKSGKHAIKVSEMESGLLLKIRGTASIQEIRIYTDAKESIKNSLKKYSTKNNLQLILN